MKIAIWILVALCGTTALTQEDGAPPYAGVWSGTLGKSKINACFGNNPSYYYLKHLDKISLARENGDKWEESVENPTTHEPEVSGEWKLRAVSEDKLEGTWTDANGAKAQSISLVRIGGLDAAQECDKSFYQPMLSKVTYGTSKFNGNEIKTIKVDGITGFNLVNAGAGPDAINRAIQTELEQAVADAYNCGPGGTSTVDIKPVYWAAKILVTAKSHEIYCGGPYPESGVDYVTWNLETGTAIDLWRWFSSSPENKDAAEPSGDGTGSPPDELNKQIIAKAKPQWLSTFPAHPTAEDEENKKSCLDVIESSSSYQVRLSETGFVFSPSLPHVVQACGVDIELSFSSVKPFLNQQGLAFVGNGR